MMTPSPARRRITIKTDVLHCFGFSPHHKLSVEQALDLLTIARNPWITLYFDGKSPRKVRSIDDFSIGHAGLSFRNLRDAGRRFDLLLLTTDRAKTVREAVHMAAKATLFPQGSTKIKLEVLSEDETRPINERVIEAATEIVAMMPKFPVWPIINYSEEDIATLKEIGAEAIRVLRGPIGCNGAITDLIDVQRLGQLRTRLEIPIVVEGGIGNELQVYEILNTPGIDAVLVNSCLFQALDDKGSIDPIYMMRMIRHAADLVAQRLPFHHYTPECCAAGQQVVER